MNQHKDAKPKTTIAKIKKILADLGITFQKEPIFFHSYNHCYSCHLICNEYPLIYANGKGLTKELALASAYAEFMERLQCYTHEWLGQVGKIIPKNYFHPDFSWQNAKKLKNEFPELFSELIEENVILEKLPCLTFESVFEYKIVTLPYYLMLNSTGSTGMCAGNTKEEALCQGICEIMERFIIRDFALGKIKSFPNIPLENLPITDQITIKLLNELKEKKLEIIIKDCTLNGKIPVLAVIIIDHQKDVFGIAFGSDPVFEIALTRCITEIYQGTKSLWHCYSQYLKKINVEIDIFNNPENLLNLLLINNQKPNYKTAFTKTNESNKFYLQFLLNHLSKNKHQIYVKDFSFLGFPSYYIYISGMSAPQPLNKDEYFYCTEVIDQIINTICEIDDKTSFQKISQLAGILAKRLNTSFLFTKKIRDQLQNLFLRIPVNFNIEAEIFMCFIFLEVKNYELALKVIKKDTYGVFDLKAILAKYCELKLNKKTKNEILEILEDHFWLFKYGNYFTHLINHNYASFYNNDPLEIKPRKFSGLPLPRCTSINNCVNCLCKSACYLDNFIKLHNALERISKNL